MKAESTGEDQMAIVENVRTIHLAPKTKRRRSWRNSRREENKLKKD